MTKQQRIDVAIQKILKGEKSVNLLETENGVLLLIIENYLKRPSVTSKYSGHRISFLDCMPIEINAIYVVRTEDFIHCDAIKIVSEVSPY